MCADLLSFFCHYSYSNFICMMFVSLSLSGNKKYLDVIILLSVYYLLTTAVRWNSERRSSLLLHRVAVAAADPVSDLRLTHRIRGLSMHQRFRSTEVLNMCRNSSSSIIMLAMMNISFSSSCFRLWLFSSVVFFFYLICFLLLYIY